MPDAPLKRVKMLLNADGLARLTAATVTVAGIGAVGSFAVEALVRSGLGHIRLVDFDTIHVSNLNRLLFAAHSTIGRPKIDVAAERVKDIAPDCRVEACDLFINEESVGRLMTPRPDVIIDAIDSVNPKATLLTAAVQAGIPVISAMGAATRVDPLAVEVADISRTQHCPLARFMRKRLRRRGVTEGIQCVYSTEPKRTREAGGSLEESLEEGWDEGLGRVRPALGSLCPVPGIFGLTCAAEAMRILLGEAWPCNPTGCL
ncbi:MAG: tRNA threonylcarbamoyladenosine dehydratase [Spartobacteria bacterium]|nr:tRNA threonylcarbamoyladenosine dehydratase [Spartobacteria bacterium]